MTKTGMGGFVAGVVGMALLMGGCAAPSRFVMSKGLVIGKAKATVRPPIAFKITNVPERVREEVAKFTEEFMADEWSKMVALPLIPPEQFRQAEARVAPDGYFDTRTGQFDWGKFKKVLDEVKATAVLEFGYETGTTQISYTTGGGMLARTSRTVTETVPSIDLWARLKDEETGAEMWRASRLVSAFHRKALKLGIFLGGSPYKAYTFEEIWSKHRGDFEKALTALAKDMRKDFGIGK